MTDLHLPWLEAVILLPLIGAVWVGRFRDAQHARLRSVVFCGLTLACATGAWLDFDLSHAKQADDAWHLLARLLGEEVLVIDQLSAPLLPLTALLYFLTSLATLRTKIRRFSFSWTLVSQAIVLATFCCQRPRGVIALLALGVVPPLFELRGRGRSVRVFAAHMALFVGLLIFGWAVVEWEGTAAPHSLWAILPLLGAVLVRSGVVPFHCWMPDMFENAAFGTALLFVLPLPGAYAAARLVLPVAPDWILQAMGLLSLATAVYAAGMALIQREPRRTFCYLFLSHSALVLMGLEMVTPIGLTGALCVWLSVAMALGGFGLTLRALESRLGRLSLLEYHGLYEQTPGMAMFFLLTGLAGVGFPGTFGFIGSELLFDGAVETYPHVGVAVVAAAALNGIAVVQMYFKLFTGARHAASVSLAFRQRERWAVLGLTAAILICGLAPQSNVSSRFVAAEETLARRAAALANSPHAASAPHEANLR